MSEKKQCLLDELTQKDAVIEQMIKDPEVKVKADGTIWIKRTRRPPKKGAEVDKDGFRNCVLRNGKRCVVYYKGYMLSVPRIVYRRFHGELDVNHEVIHIDQDSSNNSPHNLRLAAESGGAGKSLRRFSDSEVLGIRERRSAGEPLISIAESMGASSIVRERRASFRSLGSRSSAWMTPCATRVSRSTIRSIPARSTSAARESPGSAR